ncbi:MAG TPA: bifunctional glutamate N-acetyltransferase/amino-acid acetyltransferase ArgJ [Solirubrobacteraceae bacterium]|nr:bifunctional glutamate N-acetyltransferase/amino-acid acetyltransferase ArgJ [Solirubrobacteraceae bacterium]
MSEGFFQSRWVERPPHVTEREPTELAGGFRAAGVAAGIKPSGGLDVGLLVCDEAGCTSDARFTASGAPAAPVSLTRERCELGAIRAVVVNAGNANAATGRAGVENAAKMQGAASMVSGVPENRIAVCSTGVIGVPLPMDDINRGILACAHALSPEGGASFAGAIRTTDALDKQVCVEAALPSGTVTVAAQCKGAGMISPNFATLLCFVQTDAAMSAQTCALLLGTCVKRSFQRISVDGQLSTNDTVVLQASGASGVAVEPETEDELRLGEAIDAVMRELALRCVRDGEGARRVGRVVVRGGDPDGVGRVARAVADSPLVKTALYGGDPNWGRIIQAVGQALPITAHRPEPPAIDIAIEGVQVCSASRGVDHDAQALAAAVARAEVEYEITLPGDGAEAECYFSDLGHEYVTINAEYTT